MYQRQYSDTKVINSSRIIWKDMLNDSLEVLYLRIKDSVQYCKQLFVQNESKIQLLISSTLGENDRNNTANAVMNNLKWQKTKDK